MPLQRPNHMSVTVAFVRALLVGTGCTRRQLGPFVFLTLEDGGSFPELHSSCEGRTMELQEVKTKSNLIRS